MSWLSVLVRAIAAFAATNIDDIFVLTLFFAQRNLRRWHVVAGQYLGLSLDVEKIITDKTEETRKTFHALLDKTNKEHPNPKELKALSDLLADNKKLELWRDTASAGHLAELMVVENAHATAALKECWKHRLQVLKKELGSEGAPLLEQLLIQQTALCWLKLNLVELSYSSTMKQSITLTLGLYWEKRLTAAQRRFARACETLARVRKLSRNTPALQFNIATKGGQQVNVTTTA